MISSTFFANYLIKRLNLLTCKKIKLQKNLTQIDKGFDPKVYANLDGNLCGSMVTQWGDSLFDGSFIFSCIVVLSIYSWKSMKIDETSREITNILQKLFDPIVCVNWELCEFFGLCLFACPDTFGSSFRLKSQPWHTFAIEIPFFMLRTSQWVEINFEGEFMILCTRVFTKHLWNFLTVQYKKILQKKLSPQQDHQKKVFLTFPACF